MTDVSTYVEAEEYATKFYEKYYSSETLPKLGNYTTIYSGVPPFSGWQLTRVSQFQNLGNVEVPNLRESSPSS